MGLCAGILLPGGDGEVSTDVFCRCLPAGRHLTVCSLLSPTSFLHSHIYPFPPDELFAAVLSLTPASLHLQFGKKAICSFPDLLSKLTFGKCFQYITTIRAFLKINSLAFKTRKNIYTHKRDKNAVLSLTCHPLNVNYMLHLKIFIYLIDIY